MLTRRLSSAAGVTLIELIIVMVAVAIGVITLGNAYLTSANAISINQDEQITWQVAQACADHIYGSARIPGSFAAITTGTAPDPCGPAVAVTNPLGDNLPTNGATRSVVISTIAGGTEPCAGATWTCKQVVISVTKGSASATLTFMVVSS